MPISPKQASVTPPRKRGRPAAITAQQVQQVSLTSELAHKREEALEGINQIGIAVAVFLKQYADAGALGMHGPPFCKALAKQGDVNERLGKALDYLSAVGPYSELIANVLPLAMQFAVNHGRVQAEAVANFGVVPPDILETKIKLDVQEAQLAMRAQLAENEKRIQEMKLETKVPYTPPASANGGVHATTR